MTSFELSPEVQASVQQTLEAYLASDGTGDALVLATAQRICSEAHAAGMKPEPMVIAVRTAFERADGHDPLTDNVRRLAYDRLLESCIRAYFDAMTKPAR